MNLPHWDLTINGRKYRIGRAGREALRIVESGGGTIPRIDLADALNEVVPNQTLGSRYNIVTRLIDNETLEVGTAAVRNGAGRASMPVSLTNAGRAVLRAIEEMEVGEVVA